MAGHWKIQQLGCDSAAPKKNIAAMSANSMVYTDMQIRGDSMFISGGMHNQTQSVGGGGTDDYSSQVTTAVVNKPQEQKIIPFRGPNGELYIDNIGSFIVGEEDGEMELNNGLGAKMLLQRGWKRSGLPNPNAAATCIGVVAPMVVVAPVIGVVAPVGATMQRNKVIPTEGESPAEKIASLKKLLDIGAINQEEFDQKKGALLPCTDVRPAIVIYIFAQLGRMECA
jgi:hypothetical protein